LYVEASYDNTASNPLNPNSPPQTVYWGDLTGDEMFLGFFDYVPYQSGDENLALGSDELSINDGESEMYPIYPNPSSSEIKVGFALREGDDVTMTVYDMNGKLMETLEQDTYYTKGQHLVTYNTTHLATGTYRFSVEIDGRQISESFVVSK
jgi:hypothetical protein